MEGGKILPKALQNQDKTCIVLVLALKNKCGFDLSLVTQDKDKTGSGLQLGLDLEKMYHLSFL